MSTWVMSASAAAIERIVAQGDAAYGINTGFGKLAKTRIPDEQLELLQRNLILSHSVGTGEPMSDATVRLVMLTKAASLARGFSGVRPVVIDTLAFKPDFIKKNPKAVQAVVDSFFEALTMIQKEQAKAYELMGSAVKQTGAQFGGSAQFIQWQDKKANQVYFAKESMEFAKTAGDILQSNRVITKLPDYKAMQDTAFIK